MSSGQWLVGPAKYYVDLSDGQVITGPFGLHNPEPDGFTPPDGCKPITVGRDGCNWTGWSTEDDEQQTTAGQVTASADDSSAPQTSGGTRRTRRNSSGNGSCSDSASTTDAPDAAGPADDQGTPSGG